MFQTSIYKSNNKVYSTGVKFENMPKNVDNNYVCGKITGFSGWFCEVNETTIKFRYILSRF